MHKALEILWPPSCSAATLRAGDARRTVGHALADAPRAGDPFDTAWPAALTAALSDLAGKEQAEWAEAGSAPLTGKAGMSAKCPAASVTFCNE